MNDFEDLGLNESGRVTQAAGEARPHAVGSPLPMGSAGFSPRQVSPDESRPAASVPPLGRALAGPSGDPASDQPNSLQRAVNAIRMALPFVQRMLPLLDGNIASTVSNLLTPHPHPIPQPTPQQPQANLVHVEESLTNLETRHHELCEQVAEQNTSLKRVEDQLEMVREATDRNTLEQQELIEDLKAMGNKVNLFAVTLSALLLLSLVLNVILYLHIKRVLP